MTDYFGFGWVGMKLFASAGGEQGAVGIQRDDQVVGEALAYHLFHGCQLKC